MGSGDSSEPGREPSLGGWQTRLESLVRRDRLFVGLGLLLTTALAWFYIAQLPHPHTHSVWAPHAASGSVGTLALLFAMWVVMMVAMMTPTAVPMILTYTGLARRRQASHGPGPSVLALVLGYLAAWTGFSAVAAGLDWGLQQAAWLSASGQSESLALSGGLLVAAGVFQCTPLKTACLSRCRSPLALMLSQWQEGARGAWRMGLRHGLFCVGCCWALMGLMWVAGMLNLLWLAALTVYMLAEKILPAAERWAKWTGAGLVAVGVVCCGLAVHAEFMG